MADRSVACVAALRLADRGWPVFPCHPGSADGTAKSKHPLLPKEMQGFRAATCDTAAIDGWWRKWPAALIGVRPADAGLMVVDLDPKDDESPMDVVARLAKKVGCDIPLDGPISETQSGGWHLWFRRPDVETVGNRKPCPGVDIRCDNGYVIVPPSVMLSGKRYQWLTPPEGMGAEHFPAPPEKLVAVVEKAAVTAAPSMPAQPVSGGGDDAGAKAVRVYARGALDRATHEMAGAAPGGRGHALNSHAYSLGKLVAAGALSEREVWASLADAADACGLTATDGASERDAKIRRGMAAGAEDCGDVVARIEQIRAEGVTRDRRRHGNAQAVSAGGMSAAAPVPDEGDYGADAAAVSDQGGNVVPFRQESKNSPASPTPDQGGHGGGNGGAGGGNGNGVRGPDPTPGGGNGDDLDMANIPPNDLGNAERLCRRFGDDFLFAPEIGWLRFNGVRWEQEGAVAALRSAGHQTVRRLKDEARALGAHARSLDEKDWDRSALMKRSGYLYEWALKAGKSSHISGMLKEAEPYLSEPSGGLDSDRFALNVKNGTLVLSGACQTLNPHDRQDRITKLAPVEYNPDATCPVFLKSMELWQPDPEIRAFLQRFSGYALTGSVAEQVLLFHHGMGANGKSTFINLRARIMGGYAGVLPFNSIVKDERARGSEASPDLARLPGMRMVRIPEAERGQPIAAGKIKEMTGGDTITARALYRDMFEFDPVFKMEVIGNHKPVIQDQDDGIWRRMLLVPWGVKVPPGARDKALAEKLWAERSGVLNWMLDGLRMWLDEGSLRVPPAVRAATAAYREDSDPLGRFIDAMVRKLPGSDEPAQKMYKAYQAWAETVGEKAWSSKAFGQGLVERGFERKERGTGRFYLDIELVETPETNGFDDGG